MTIITAPVTSIRMLWLFGLINPRLAGYLTVCYAFTDQGKDS